MPIVLTEPRILDWLSQFDPSDQIIAGQLLHEVDMIDANELMAGLRSKIFAYAVAHSGPIALYAERAIRRQNGRPDSLFKETAASPRRAYGFGPPPVPPGFPCKRDTGSEGIIATMISQLARERAERFLDHPGPDQIRTKKVRTYLVVTDFIGTGRRASDNIETAWKRYSFKSWHSLHRLRFAVVSYSGLPRGVRYVEEHRARPRVLLYRGCRTIHELPAQARKGIIELCNRYAPKATENFTALGYADGGALIAFDHGMPNNAPLVLHARRSRVWPLFPSRSAASMGDARRLSTRKEELERALLRLQEKRLAVAPRLEVSDHEAQNLVLILAALKRRPRKPIALSARTGLTVAEVDKLVVEAQRKGYVDGQLKLTHLAFDTLAYLREARLPKPPLPMTDNSLYCPQSMRPPRDVI